MQHKALFGKNRSGVSNKFEISLEFYRISSFS
jgi:hypothetical protein